MGGGVINIILWHTARGRCDHSGTGLIQNNIYSYNKNKRNPLILFSVYLKQFDMRQKQGRRESLKMTLESAKIGFYVPRKEAPLTLCTLVRRKKNKKIKTIKIKINLVTQSEADIMDDAYTALLRFVSRDTWLRDA